MGDRVPGPERYAEGQREEAECRKCGQPIWIVYHGPRANHTVEPRALSAALDACPGLVWLTESELARVYVDHDNSCPHVAWKGDRSKPCTCGGSKTEAKLRAALRPVEREGEG